MNELWKPIEGTYYTVSNFGRVKSLPRNTAHERILKQRLNRDGYYYVNLSINGKTKTYKPHRLVAQMFIPNPNNLPQVNHKDGDKTNNNIDNLEWCDASYNQKHAVKLGLTHPWMKGVKGKNCMFSKKIYQYDMENNLIKEWDCMSDVQRELGIPVPHLVRVCKGQRKTTRGYKWSYAKEGGI